MESILDAEIGSLPASIITQPDVIDPISIPPGDSPLCEICRGLFYCRRLEDVRLTQRVVDVVSGAGAGCRFCQVLWGVMEADENQAYLVAARDPRRLEYAQTCEFENNSHGLDVFWRSLNDDYDELYAWLERIPSPDTCTLAKVPRTFGQAQVQSYTSSKCSLDLANRWLRGCVVDHPLCGDPTFQTRRLPTRLLRVYNGGLSLCHGTDLPPTTLYVTLSHRWGSNSENQLTAAQYESGPIHWAPGQLLLTFRDAVTVTQNLGINHLWIDSLCIIQDSDEDRARECAQMWEVYGNSYCNIAASASFNGTQGIFRNHEVGGPLPCQITPQWEKRGGEASDDNARCGFHFSAMHDFREQIETSPLGQRAWVVQERLLAPRVLYFAKFQLYWECRELAASEKYPSGLPDSMDMYACNKPSMDPCKLFHVREVRSCYKAWIQYVQLYSRCRLTRPEDKLVALAGIAHRVGEALQVCGAADNYLAGLWRRELLAQLLWEERKTDNMPDCRKCTGPYRAPSWSWASVDGEVFLEKEARKEDQYRATIDGAYTTTSIDPFGAVTAGAIDVYAPLVRIQPEIDFDKRGDFPGRLKAHPTLDLKFNLFLDEHQYLDPETLESPDIHALLLLRNHGLLLRPVTPDKSFLHGTFTKIGTFSILVDMPSALVITALTGIEDPDLVYKERKEDGMYLVTII